MQSKFFKVPIFSWVHVNFFFGFEFLPLLWDKKLGTHNKLSVVQCWWRCLLRPVTCICEGDSPERTDTSRQCLKNEYWNIHRWREHKVLLCAAGFHCFFKILFWEMFRGKHLSWHGSHLMKPCMIIYLLALFLVFALWLSGSHSQEVKVLLCSFALSYDITCFSSMILI